MVAEQTPERFSYSKREELSRLASGFLPMRNTQLTRKMPITANIMIPNPTSLIIVPPQFGCAATQRTYSWKMAILGY
jgi:hypothetical protein